MPLQEIKADEITVDHVATTSPATLARLPSKVAGMPTMAISLAECSTVGANPKQVRIRAKAFGQSAVARTMISSTVPAVVLKVVTVKNASKATANSNMAAVAALEMVDVARRDKVVMNRVVIADKVVTATVEATAISKLVAVIIVTNKAADTANSAATAAVISKANKAVASASNKAEAIGKATVKVAATNKVVGAAMGVPRSARSLVDRLHATRNPQAS